jgi:hypothetical protein
VTYEPDQNSLVEENTNHVEVLENVRNSLISYENNPKEENSKKLDKALDIRRKLKKQATLAKQ